MSLSRPADGHRLTGYAPTAAGYRRWRGHVQRMLVDSPKGMPGYEEFIRGELVAAKCGVNWESPPQI